MFRVPTDTHKPTFDDTMNISFWRWLTSSVNERRFWKMMRNMAASTAQQNQAVRAKLYAEQMAGVTYAAMNTAIEERVADGRWDEAQAETTRQRANEAMLRFN